MFCIRCCFRRMEKLLLQDIQLGLLENAAQIRSRDLGWDFDWGGGKGTLENVDDKNRSEEAIPHLQHAWSHVQAAQTQGFSLIFKYVFSSYYVVSNSKKLEIGINPIAPQYMALINISPSLVSSISTLYSLARCRRTTMILDGLSPISISLNLTSPSSWILEIILSFIYLMFFRTLLEGIAILSGWLPPQKFWEVALTNGISSTASSAFSLKSFC